jgi:hypothetical protein
MIIKQIFTVKYKIQIFIQADISTIISKNIKKETTGKSDCSLAIPPLLKIYL